MNLLLETCSLLWLTDDPQALSTTARAVLGSADAVVYVSALSAWELGLKTAKGKLDLPRPVSQWFPEIVASYRLREIGISASIAALSTELPPIHADPFDRLLIATAQLHQWTIVTADQVIPRYPNLLTLW